MIELFDATRLVSRRDYSLALVAAAMALGVAGMGAQAWSLRADLAQLQAEQSALQARLAAAPPPKAPGTALLADLQRELTRLELESGSDPASAGTVASTMPPSHWMDRFAALGSAEVSLVRIEVDRAGAVRVEGLAASPQAITAFLQAWDQQQALQALPDAAPVQARALEVRQDMDAAGRWRFKLRASLPSAKGGA